jgi:hypothetical protein
MSSPNTMIEDFISSAIPFSATASATKPSPSFPPSPADIIFTALLRARGRIAQR